MGLEGRCSCPDITKSPSAVRARSRILVIHSRYERGEAGIGWYKNYSTYSKYLRIADLKYDIYEEQEKEILNFVKGCLDEIGTSKTKNK